jgi:hypothetical protein
VISFEEFFKTPILIESNDKSSYFNLSDTEIITASYNTVTLNQIYSHKIEVLKIDLIGLYKNFRTKFNDANKANEITSNLEREFYEDAKKSSLECKKILEVAEALLLNEAYKLGEQINKKITDLENKYE